MIIRAFPQDSIHKSNRSREIATQCIIRGDLAVDICGICHKALTNEGEVNDKLKGIRIHGRGGQGSVLAAELLAVAAFEDGQYGQAFPVFGGERRGAPVLAFVRLSDREIRLRTRIQYPDYVIIQDTSLIGMVDVTAGLKSGGVIIANSDGPKWTTWPDGVSVYTVPALQIAADTLGKPFLNPAMLGAFAAASGEIRLSSIQKAFRMHFPGDLGEKNARAVQLGYERVEEQ
jgi:pyruvate ferredoxin oxidoreductase gamma subunit